MSAHFSQTKSVWVTGLYPRAFRGCKVSENIQTHSTSTEISQSLLRHTRLTLAGQRAPRHGQLTMLIPQPVSKKWQKASYLMKDPLNLSALKGPLGWYRASIVREPASLGVSLHITASTVTPSYSWRLGAEDPGDCDNSWVMLGSIIKYGNLMALKSFKVAAGSSRFYSERWLMRWG